MSRTVWIVIPTYNELGNIERSAPAACRELERVAPGNYRVLIVDDSSPDGTGVDRRDKTANVGRIVGHVGVHLEHEVGARRERARKAGQIGRSETLALRPVQHLDPAVAGCGKAIGDFAGAVWRGVIDDQDAVVARRDTFQLAAGRRG
jgi:glycosyltransferase involved in cell wall biosynthesis